MEVKKKKAIVLTPEGQFMEHHYHGQPPEIGAEIEFKQQSNWDHWGLIRIAALLVIIVIPFLALQPLFTPTIFAYVTVDINPSIELAIDKKEKVLSVTPLNNEGQELIAKVNLENIPLEEALELITEAAIQEKYISSDRENTVFISYSKVDQNNTLALDQEREINTKNEIKRAQLEEKVKEVVNRNQQQASVEFVQVSFELRDKAKEIGLSSGKFALILEAQDIGLAINIDSIKDKGIVHAIKEAGGNPGQIIKHLHNNSNKYLVSEKQNNLNQIESIREKLEQQESNLSITFDQEEISKDINLTKEDFEKIKEIKEATLDKLTPEAQKELNTKLLEKFKENAPQQLIDKLKENITGELKEKNIQDVSEEESSKELETETSERQKEGALEEATEQEEIEVRDKEDTKNDIENDTEVDN